MSTIPRCQKQHYKKEEVPTTHKPPPSTRTDLLCTTPLLPTYSSVLICTETLYAQRVSDVLTALGFILARKMGQGDSRGTRSKDLYPYLFTCLFKSSKTTMQKRTKEVPSHQEVTHKGMPRDPVGLSICIL